MITHKGDVKMKNKNSEKDEINCLNKVVSSSVCGRYATAIHKYLKSICTDLNSSERPDFIYYDDTKAFGLEHCLVDGLPNDKGDSFSRKANNDIKNAIDNRNGDSEKDMVEICSIVSDSLNCLSDFSYECFINSFTRVCLNHNSKCEKDGDYGYKNHLRKFSSNITIGCLIEIPITYAYEKYVITNNGKSTEKTLCTLPFTYDMLNIIEEMSAFDFVIVCVHSTKHTGVTYFNPKNMQRCIRQQHIKPCDSFEYKKPPKTPITYRKTDGGYELKHNVF